MQLSLASKINLVIGALTALTAIALGILLFNLLIVVHELGHFWAARWRGLKVEKFQIWFA